MDNLILSIEQPLQLLIYTTIIILVVITVFLVKLLVEASSLVKSLQGLSVIIKQDLEPTIKELKRTLINLNSMTIGAESQFKSLNEGISILTNSTKGIMGKAGVVADSLKKGILAGINVFLEKRKNK